MAVSTETRVNDWFSVEGSPAWVGSGISAYRVWQQFDGRRWHQRHEWKRADGSTDLENWIDGASGWCVGSVKMAEAA
jgi:hypothetical protein